MNDPFVTRSSESALRVALNQRDVITDAWIDAAHHGLDVLIVRPCGVPTRLEDAYGGPYPYMGVALEARMDGAEYPIIREVLSTTPVGGP